MQKYVLLQMMNPKNNQLTFRGIQSKRSGGGGPFLLKMWAFSSLHAFLFYFRSNWPQHETLLIIQ